MKLLEFSLTYSKRLIIWRRFCIETTQSKELFNNLLIHAKITIVLYYYIKCFETDLFNYAHSYLNTLTL